MVLSLEDCCVLMRALKPELSWDLSPGGLRIQQEIRKAILSRVCQGAWAFLSGHS